MHVRCRVDVSLRADEDRCDELCLSGLDHAKQRVGIEWFDDRGTQRWQRSGALDEPLIPSVMPTAAVPHDATPGRLWRDAIAVLRRCLRRRRDIERPQRASLPAHTISSHSPPARLTRSAQQIAAIDHDQAARHVAGRQAEQEQGHRGDLAWLADAPQRDARGKGVDVHGLVAARHSCRAGCHT